MVSIIKSFDEYIEKYKGIVNSIELDCEKIEGSKEYYYETSLEYPLSFIENVGNEGNIVFINPEYYCLHQEKIEQLIEDTLRTTTQDTINLNSSEIVIERFLKTITENVNIKRVKLSFFKPISKNLVNMILSGSVKQLECSVNFKNNKINLINDYVPGLVISNYMNIQGVLVNNFGGDITRLEINSNLTKKQLKNLKKIFEKYPQETVMVDFQKTDQIKEIIDVIKSKRIVIKDRKEYGREMYKFIDDNYDNILFLVSLRSYVSPKVLKLKEDILDIMVNEVKDKGLSPLEEYMYLYNMVKLFKKYKEVPNKKDRSESREIVFTLFNDYMVCVGYSLLLEELVNRLGDDNISICEYGCEFVTRNGENGGHSRCLVKIKDDKYGIDGIYISDPTWDSIRTFSKVLNEDGECVHEFTTPLTDIDLYNHFLMTVTEVEDETIKRASPDITDALFRNSDNFDIKKVPIDIYGETVAVIRKLNSNKVLTDDEIDKEFGQEIPKQISGELLATVIKNIYSTIYFSDNVDALVDRTIYYNDLIHESKFNNTKEKFSNVLVKHL